MHTFLTPEPITVEIRNASGEIRIDLADVTTTTVDVIASASHPLGFLDDVIRAAKTQFAGDRRAFAGSGKGRFDESFDNDSMPEDPTDRVRVDLRESTANPVGSSTLIVDTDPARDGWKSSFTVHVTAPSASGIRIQSQSADVVVTGRADRLETRTASGDVSVADVDARSVVQTASGDVRVSSTADCDVRTASGDIEVGKVSAEAILHSTSGDIRLDNATGNISARSVSGDVRVLDASIGRTEIITVSGDVEVGIHAGSLAAVDLNTVSGTTNSDFEVSDQVPSGDDDVEEGPVLDLRVKTTSGNIRLRKSIAV
jgi:DUF4097 and DUF4098 domain-containing protein YvlB